MRVRVQVVQFPAYRAVRGALAVRHHWGHVGDYHALRGCKGSVMMVPACGRGALHLCTSRPQDLLDL